MKLSQSGVLFLDFGQIMNRFAKNNLWICKLSFKSMISVMLPLIIGTTLFLSCVPFEAHAFTANWNPANPATYPIMTPAFTPQFLLQNST